MFLISKLIEFVQKNAQVQTENKLQGTTIYI